MFRIACHQIVIAAVAAAFEVDVVAHIFFLIGMIDGVCVLLILLSSLSRLVVVYRILHVG